ncbi:UNVERIFIED_CONTAM: protein ZW2 [Sesamum calycinum]|uniref:Protein ZW2 n=1 Tax=Sesamum calycinum TaxID=2727403 RepID=A0AAW2RPX5_9LAMI
MVLPTQLQTNDSAQTFEAFVDQWFIDKEHHLRDLLGLIARNSCDNEVDEVQCKDLIDRVIRHYGRYFEAKARMIADNVFLVLMPTWFSSFERAYLWMGGFRPGLAFRLVINNVLDLSEEQSWRMNRLMTEIKEEEKDITDEFDKVQEVMVITITSFPYIAINLGGQGNSTDAGIVEARGPAEERGGDNMELLVDQLKSAVGALVERADYLRMKTGIMLMEMLKSSQTIRFLAAAMQLQLRLRRRGMMRDAESQMHRFETQPI